MLDIMRRHASSWLIKVLFGAIIISFIFFFGYSSLSRSGRGGEGEAAARVNGRPIPMAEFRFFYEQNSDRIASSFQGQEVPDFARTFALNMTLGQLVQRELLLEQADELGVVIPDAELAALIVEVQKQQQGGTFDPISYRHTFLPMFKQRTGLDYEQFVRQDMEIERFQELFAAVGTVSPFAREEETPVETTWTFEQVTIDPLLLTEGEKVASNDEAKALAEKLAGSDPKEWRRTLKPVGVAPETVGPITLAERTKIFGGSGTFEDYRQLFALTKEDPVFEGVVTRGGKHYLVRLLKTTERAVEEPHPFTPPPFLSNWMQQLRATATVESYVGDEEG